MIEISKEWIAVDAADQIAAAGETKQEVRELLRLLLGLDPDDYDIVATPKHFKGGRVDDRASDLEVHEQALSNVRDGLAAVESAPAVAFSGGEHEQLVDAEAALRALERSLSNRVEQKRTRSDGDPDG